MSGKKALRIVGALVIAVNFSCGIDSYIYLDPVTSVNSTMNYKAVLRLPNSSDTITIDFAPGKNPTMTGANQRLGNDYSIYYRIYLSDSLEQTVNTADIRTRVNSALDLDWKAFEPYTVDSNNNASQVASLFSNRKYYPIEVNSSGQLLRSTGNSAFNPKPANRLFINSDDLIDRTYMTATDNADVQDKSGATGKLYTYVSMYIVMTGIDDSTLTQIYSSPAFINVFLLPDTFTNVPVTGVSLPATATASPAVQLNAVIAPPSASNKGVTWTVSDPALATIKPTETSAIVASKVTSGTVTVTATTIDGGFSSAPCVITLDGKALEAITLSPAALTLHIGATETLFPDYTPPDAKTQSVTWSSTDESIVTVSSSGAVTAHALSGGKNVSIIATATDDSLVSAVCPVVVN